MTLQLAKQYPSDGRRFRAKLLSQINFFEKDEPKVSVEPIIKK